VGVTNPPLQLSMLLLLFSRFMCNTQYERGCRGIWYSILRLFMACIPSARGLYSVREALHIPYASLVKENRGDQELSDCGWILFLALLDIEIMAHSLQSYSMGDSM